MGAHRTVHCHLCRKLWWQYFRQEADKEKWPTWKAAARKHNHGWLWLRPHDCLPNGVKCNAPPFLGSRQKLEPDEVVRMRCHATLHIRVKRAKERGQIFQITHFFPAMLCPLAEHIIFVCAFRTLFEDPLVPCLPEPEGCWSCDGHFSSQLFFFLYVFEEYLLKGCRVLCLFRQFLCPLCCISVWPWEFVIIMVTK